MPDPATLNPTIEAHDSQAVADAVRDAVKTGVPIIDYGIAHSGLGRPPPQRHRRLAQRGTIIEHYDRDMTVRAAAGCTMGQLQTALAPTEQCLPIDADDDLSIGEVINHNVYGSLRVRYGAARDLLLGLAYVDGQGEPITVGGRTVKNVAGYDVTRLMVGSLGELGVLTEATLRTYALPAAALAVEVAVANPVQFDQILPKWLLTDAAPASLALASVDGSFVARLAYLGRPSANEIQFRCLQALVDPTQGMALGDCVERDFAQEQRDRAGQRAWRRTSTAVLKILVPPAWTGQVCQGLAQQPVTHVEAYPVHGCIYVGGNLAVEQARQLDGQAEGLIDPCGGMRVWVAQPDRAHPIEPFAPPQPDWPILERLKGAMDPHGVLNPNRFLPVQQPAPAPRLHHGE